MATLNESLALQAAGLYSSGLTFQKISKELEISQGRVGPLVREGISAMMNNGLDPAVITPDQPGDERKNTLENTYIPAQRHNPRPDTYLLEATVSQKRVDLTPKALQIYDLFRYWGFSGDLSDFAEDGINLLYMMVRPINRMNPRLIL